MTLHRLECLTAMKQMSENSVDSIVTDPPYELGFMGKSWDNAGIAYSVEMWSEALRILKPGGHLLAFGGTRTYHRMACAIEDAGFEIRDSIHWIYGSGFPKSKNVALSIDKGEGLPNRGRAIPTASKYQASDIKEQNKLTSNPVGPYEPRTEKAQQWQGWGTALKPAHEPIVVARKPLIGTVAANVLEYGTGALNIDGCRIGTGTGETKTVQYPDIRGNNYNNAEGTVEYTVTDQGRWPANIIFDEDAGAELDAQSGVSKSGVAVRHNGVTAGTIGSLGKCEVGTPDLGYGDTGGASRFFYCAKASKSERNAGLEGLEEKEIGTKGNGLARTCGTCSASVLDGCDCPDRTFNNPTRQNFHPTVKPLALMRYLVRLVTPPGGVVFDPFLGSGTTAVAAILEGFDWAGCEMTEDYWPIIEARVEWAKEQSLEIKEPTLFEMP